MCPYQSTSVVMDVSLLPNDTGEVGQVSFYMTSLAPSIPAVCTCLFSEMSALDVCCSNPVCDSAKLFFPPPFTFHHNPPNTSVPVINLFEKYKKYKTFISVWQPRIHSLFSHRSSLIKQKSLKNCNDLHNYCAMNHIL